MSVDLSVGKKYRTGSGNEVRIISSEKGDNCRIFIGLDNNRYFQDGSISTIGVENIPVDFDKFCKENSLVSGPC